MRGFDKDFKEEHYYGTPSYVTGISKHRYFSCSGVLDAQYRFTFSET